MDEQKQILKLAAEIACMDFAALEDGWRRRLQILDSQIEAFRELEGAYKNKLADMDEAIKNLVAVCKVCSRLNILCTTVGESKPKEPPNEKDKDLSEKLTDWH